ncbi:MAG: hypothetical protein ACI4VQ_04945 [Clostridia bacterium]
MEKEKILEYFNKIIKEKNIKNYEIVEDSYEYENGLMLIIYEDKKHEIELEHICIEVI